MVESQLTSFNTNRQTADLRLTMDHIKVFDKLPSRTSDLFEPRTPLQIRNKEHFYCEYSLKYCELEGDERDRFTVIPPKRK